VRIAALHRAALGAKQFGLHRKQWAMVLLHVILVCDLLYWDTYLQVTFKGALDWRHFSLHDTLYTAAAFGVCILSAYLHSNLYGSDPGWVTPGGPLEDPERSPCQYCGVRAPLRSRHCFVSGQCVVAFDHYCDLLSTPIGTLNHRRFWVYLLIQTFVVMWGLILAWSAVGACLAPAAMRSVSSQCWTLQPVRSTVLLMSAMFMLSLFLLFGSLWLLHCYLISTAQTTYEMLKGISVPYLSLFYATYFGPHARQLPYSSVWPEIIRRLALGHPPPTPFSEGFVRNWELFLFAKPGSYRFAYRTLL